MKTKNLLIGTTLLLAIAAPATYAEFTIGLDLIKDSGTRNVDYQYESNNGSTSNYPLLTSLLVMVVLVSRIFI